jgi:hypothetical protein
MDAFVVVGTVAFLVAMDKWVVRKTRTLNNPKECPQIELGQTPVFRFQDSLYNSHLTGHQKRSGGVAPSTSWMHMREQKIKSQLPDRSSNIFKGVNIYINGKSVQLFKMKVL